MDAEIKMPSAEKPELWKISSYSSMKAETHVGVKTQHMWKDFHLQPSSYRSVDIYEK